MKIKEKRITQADFTNLLKSLKEEYKTIFMYQFGEQVFIYRPIGRKEYKNLINQKEERKLKESNINSFIETLKKGEILFEWDDAIFNFTLEKAIVHKDKSITFKFYSGFETTIKNKHT